MIRKQEESRRRIFLELNLAIMNAVIEPMDREPEPVRNLSYGEKPRYGTRMGLMAGVEAVMLQPQSPDCTH